MTAHTPVETQYARVGDASVAYQVSGEGPHDVLFIPGFVSNVEHYWEVPEIAAILDRFGAYSRLVRYDKRGSGMSDPLAAVPTIDDRLDDALAVMDAAGQERAHIFGVSEGGPLAILFAATYPERVESLVLYGAAARYTRADDYPDGWPPDLYENDTLKKLLIDEWGSGPLLEFFAPSLQDDQAFQARWGAFLRAGGSPAMGIQTLEAVASIDVRDALPSIQAPALMIHRAGDRCLSLNCATYTAERIPDCRMLVLPGDDHLWFVGDPDEIFDPVEEFITGSVRPRSMNRLLATVLFTDIVDSTATAAKLGDADWRSLLERHDELMRREVDRHRGRLIKTTGDGVLATFDGPTRGLACARAARDGAAKLGLELRAGLHTGECELLDDDIAGVAVHIAARISARAGAGEVLTSSTVKDLSVGSGVEFADRGSAELKGVPGEWQIYSAG